MEGSYGTSALKDLPVEHRAIPYAEKQTSNDRVLLYDRAATQTTTHITLSAWQRFYLPVKRVCDVVLSLLGLIVTAPILLLATIAIKLEGDGPVIYKQMRVGKDGRQFEMYKFRSMCAGAERMLEQLRDHNEVDGPVFKIMNDPRVTRVGRFIRRYSIDELPQLLNILKGDMSIVGPRPPLPAEVEQYTPFQMNRLSVTPGLTCYWQISGRSHLSFEQWVERDIQYIQRMSLFTDTVIVLRTIPVVLFGIGAY